MTLPRLHQLTLRGVQERPARTALTAIGVGLGVAMFVGASLANVTTQKAFRSLLDTTVGRADVVVVSTASPLPADAVERARRAPGVERAEGVTHAIAHIRIRVDAGTPAARSMRPLPGHTLHFPVFSDVQVDVLGLDRSKEGSLFAPTVRSGRLPHDGEMAIAVPRFAAEHFGARPGTMAQISTSAEPTARTIPVLVSGILADSAAPTDSAVASLAVTSALGAAPAPSQIDIVLSGRIDADVWVADHGRDFGSTARLIDKGSVLRPFRSSVEAPLRAIGGVALLALLVGMFLIYLTLSTMVVERTRHYGVLRAIGASRPQVRRAVMVEAVAIGIAGTAVGLVLGIGVGVAMLRAVASSVGLHLSTIAISPGTLAIGAVAGVVTTVIAAVLPARRAARLSVVEALQGFAAVQRRTSPVAVAGSVALALGLVITLFGHAHRPFDGIGSLLLIVGGVVAIPVLLGPVTRVLVTIAGRVSPSVWRVAVRQSGREQSRAATTLGLVMVVFALVLAVDSGVAAVNAAVASQLRAQFGADVRFTSAEFDARTTAMVSSTHDVVSVTDIARGQSRPYLVDHVSETTELAAIDPASYFQRGGFAWTKGDNESVRAAFQHGGAVVLPEPLAHRIGASIGSTVRLATSQGPKPFVVAGRYVSLINQSDIVVSTADAAVFDTWAVRELDVYTTTGRAGAVRDDVVAKLANEHKFVGVQMAGTLRDNVTKSVGRYTSLYNALLGVALLIGVLGLANTLAMAALERRREIGILRAVGTQRRTVAALFVAESATLTAIAYLLAVPLGALVAANLVPGIGRTVGIPAAYHAPWNAIPALAVVAILVAVAAAAIPARRAASTDPIAALRAD
jgi:putative ABC transport system permease protein